MNYDGEVAAEIPLPTAEECHKRLAEASARYRQRISEMSAQRDLLSEQIDRLQGEHQRIEAAALTFNASEAKAAASGRGYTGELR